MKPTPEQMRIVAQYLADKGLYHAAGVLLADAAAIEWKQEAAARRRELLKKL